MEPKAKPTGPLLAPAPWRPTIHPLGSNQPLQKQIVKQRSAAREAQQRIKDAADAGEEGGAGAGSSYNNPEFVDDAGSDDSSDDEPDDDIPITVRFPARPNPGTPPASPNKPTANPNNIAAAHSKQTETKRTNQVETATAKQNKAPATTGDSPTELVRATTGDALHSGAPSSEDRATMGGAAHVGAAEGRPRMGDAPHGVAPSSAECAKIGARKRKRRDLDDEDRPHVCGWCGQGFWHGFQMRGHIKNVHSPNKLLCRLCPSVLRNEHTFKCHLATMHPAHVNDPKDQLYTVVPLNNDELLAGLPPAPDLCGFAEAQTTTDQPTTTQHPAAPTTPCAAELRHSTAPANTHSSSSSNAVSSSSSSSSSWSSSSSSMTPGVPSSSGPAPIITPRPAAPGATHQCVAPPLSEPSKNPLVGIRVSTPSARSSSSSCMGAVQVSAREESGSALSALLPPVWARSVEAFPRVVSGGPISAAVGPWSPPSLSPIPLPASPSYLPSPMSGREAMEGARTPAAALLPTVSPFTPSAPQSCPPPLVAHPPPVEHPPSIDVANPAPFQHHPPVTAPTSARAPPVDTAYPAPVQPPPSVVAAPVEHPRPVEVPVVAVSEVVVPVTLSHLFRVAPMFLGKSEPEVKELFARALKSRPSAISTAAVDTLYSLFRLVADRVLPSDPASIDHLLQQTLA